MCLKLIVIATIEYDLLIIKLIPFYYVDFVCCDVIVFYLQCVCQYMSTYCNVTLYLGFLITFFVAVD